MFYARSSVLSEVEKCHSFLFHLEKLFYYHNYFQIQVQDTV